MKTYTPPLWNIIILILAVQGCDSGISSNDTDTRSQDTSSDKDTASTPTVCADENGIYHEVCAEICLNQTTEEACEGMVLPHPNTEEYAYVGHGCNWYKATETQIDDDGTCTFGEELYVCGYAFWGDIWCSGYGMKCGDEEYSDMNKNTSYLEKDGRVFLIKSSCAPNDSESLKGCVWADVNDNYYLKKGIPECECGCILETQSHK